MTSEPTYSVIQAVEAELAQAQLRFPPMHSAHEGYAIILEELDELFEHIRCKQGMRLVHEMKREAIQIAAMAIRFALDVCGPESGQR